MIFQALASIVQTSNWSRVSRHETNNQSTDISNENKNKWFYLCVGIFSIAVLILDTINQQTNINKT